ncbi:MAG: hypothetical protein RLZZ453_1249 [Chlamydiota bacterium]
MKTKIVCTMGPSVDSEEKIDALIHAGMSCARINFSHGTQAEHRVVIERLKKCRQKNRVPLAIMLDTKGPEIRLGMVEKEQFSVEKGDLLTLTSKPVLGNKQSVQITPSCVLQALTVGTKVLIDDGYLMTEVVEQSPESVVVKCGNSAWIRSQKGVNIPGIKIDLPAMTAQDVDDIRFGVKEGIDMIAASFIRSRAHVEEIRKLLCQEGAPHIPILAKIENSLGVEHFDEILEAADGIMVARGDLGVELPLKKIPSLQKMMIRKCYQAGKTVVTATQMLESMIKNPRPTRAEVSDVANAIYDSTSAVMLSGETAVGAYPIETVQMMRSIVEEAEGDFEYRRFFDQQQLPDCKDISSSIALAAVRAAYSTGAKAIFCCTHSGFTAQRIARFRPSTPIFVFTSAYHQMAIDWGIIPVDLAPASTLQEAVKVISAFAISKRLLKKGDVVIVTGGTPFGKIGSTNMMLVETV